MQNSFISAIGKALSEDISILCALEFKKNRGYIHQWKLLMTERQRARNVKVFIGYQQQQQQQQSLFELFRI